ncbi:hypothetical protein VD659_16230 [Herbiconiux sp. 11R-BC]|uniref:hypothetical protein n=1 Tax=Herbiconiux sp. 11R-BC TaxID=3111637 RepID=UPI003C10CD6D
MTLRLRTSYGATTPSGWKPWNSPGPFREVVRDFSGMLIRSRSIDPQTGLTTVTLATRDAKLHDHAHMSATTPELFAPTGYTTAPQIVNWVLGYIGESLGEVSGVAAGSTFVRADNPWRTGTTAWDFISPLVQKLGLRLWCDETGLWHLRENTLPTAESATFSGASTLIQAVDTIDMESTVVESVLVIYEWTDSSGVQHRSYDAASKPGSSRLPLVVTYNRPFPGAGAAARILSERLRRTRAVPITAVSDYRLGPGTPISLIDVPNSPNLTGSVRSVTWNFPEDEMQLETRDIQE